jgi:hypothetical protein
MTRSWYLAAALVAALLVACGGSGGPPSQVRPATTASAAVQSFMKAVADSNLPAMASLWGTARGAAATTHQPPDYERRIAVMRSYLGHDDYRILSDQPDGTEARHAVMVQLRRQACTYNVPFTLIQLSDQSWIVNQVDLTTAGNPAKGCDPSQQDTSPAARP